MKTHTEHRLVEGTIYIWAYPKREWLDGEWHNTGSWEYELSTYGTSNYREGAINVHSEEITVMCPAGIPLLDKAIDTLRAEIKATQAEAQKKITKLNAQIQGLLRISHQPEDNNVIDVQD